LANSVFRRVAIVVAIGAGLAERLWLLFHVAINSDAAVAGMMAQRAFHDQQFVFTPEEVYGGVEPYLEAPFVWIFGPSSASLQVAPMILAAAAAVLTWRIVRRLVGPGSAALAGAMVWVFPAIDVGDASTLDLEFRGVTLTCGLACLLLAMELLDDQRWSTSRWMLLGAFAGVGWWSSVEFLYFALPLALMLIGVLVVATDIRHRVLAPALALLAFGVGALPWLVANVRSHWASIHPNNFPGASSSLLSGFDLRLKVFFEFTLPMQLNMRETTSGRWYLGAAGPVVAALAYAVIVVAILGCLARRGRWAAIGLAGVAIPFVFASSPATWFWQDGRYGIFVWPLLVVVLVGGFGEIARRLPLVSTLNVAAPAVLILLAAFSFASFSTLGPSIFNGTPTTSFLGGWGNPDQSALQAIANLEARHETRGYADYWVAMRLDYLSAGRLVIDPSGLGGDPDVWPDIDATVRGTSRPVWIFVRPSAAIQWSGTAGPDGESLPTFLAALTQFKIHYRLWTDGQFTIVSARQEVLPRSIAGGLTIGG
jgi:hypothetical protein